MAKTKVGKMACESCGEPVIVKQNELETLSYRCDECDAAPYARVGTGQHKRWLEKVGAESQPVKQQSMKAATQPDAAKPKSTNMWGLES